MLEFDTDMVLLLEKLAFLESQLALTGHCCEEVHTTRILFGIVGAISEACGDIPANRWVVVPCLNQLSTAEF